MADPELSSEHRFLLDGLCPLPECDHPMIRNRFLAPTVGSPSRSRFLFFDELDAHTATHKRLNNAPQVVKVTRQAVCHDIALPCEGEQEFELGAVHILARGLVRENLADLRDLELANRVLVKGADADVSDALTVHMKLL